MLREFEPRLRELNPMLRELNPMLRELESMLCENASLSCGFMPVSLVLGFRLGENGSMLHEIGPNPHGPGSGITTFD